MTTFSVNMAIFSMAIFTVDISSVDISSVDISSMAISSMAIFSVAKLYHGQIFRAIFSVANISYIITPNFLSIVSYSIVQVTLNISDYMYCINYS